MAAPRPAVNGSTLSVGFTTKLVTVQSVSPDGKTAICVDRQNTQVAVPMLVQRSKGVLPAAGETWLVTQDLGQWTFAAYVASDPSQFQKTTAASGVYTQGTAPGDPSVGELWVNTAISNMLTVWNGTNWVPVQFGAVAIQPGSLTGAQLAEEANIAASQVNFTATDIGGITTTISATQPSNPSFGDLWYDAENGYQLNQWTGTQWIPLQFGTQAISARAVTAELIAANTITASQMAAGIVYAGIINGTIVDAATFIGSTFEGTDFILNSAGGFFYSSTPGLGNLLATISSQPGTDGLGNPYQAGIFLYGPSGSFAAMIDNGSYAALLLNPAGATHLTVTPQLFGSTTSPGAVNEGTLLVLTSGKENGHDDAALQLFSASADNTVPAHAVFEFGGTVFAEITKTGLVLPGNPTPAPVAGSMLLFADPMGSLRVIDGNDQATYAAERKTLFNSANSGALSGLTTLFGAQAMNTGSYRIHGQLYVEVTTAGTQFEMFISVPVSYSGRMSYTVTRSGVFYQTISGALNTALTTSVSSGLGASAGTPYVVTFDGLVTALGASTFSLDVAPVGGTTIVIDAFSFMDIMPV